jgi:catechol 2,3-dioxygenase-like lactoylglutathione lyase family enzyme
MFGVARRWTLSAVLTLFVVELVAPGNVCASSTVVESKFELFVTDAEESIVFYQLLGFHIAHQKDYGYTTLQSGSTVIALSPIPGWIPLRWFGFLRGPPLGVEIVLYSEQLESLRSILEEEGYAPSEIETQSWGDRDFRVRDYDGYYIRVSEGQAVPRSD